MTGARSSRTLNVQLPQQRWDMVTPTSTADQPSCILCQLEAAKWPVIDAVQQWVAVVHATGDELLDKRLGAVTQSSSGQQVGVGEAGCSRLDRRQWRAPLAVRDNSEITSALKNDNTRAEPWNVPARDPLTADVAVVPSHISWVFDAFSWSLFALNQASTFVTQLVNMFWVLLAEHPRRVFWGRFGKSSA